MTTASACSNYRLRPRLGGVLLGLLALFATDAPASDVEAPAPSAAELVVYALTLIDTPYRQGGNRPSLGFDCSGFVRYVFGESLGLALPRRSEEMRRAGAVVNSDAVEPGDLVFFNTLGRPWSHVAIAIGEDRFVHAPARGGRVRIEKLSDSYWRARFNGARRLELTQAGRHMAAVMALVEDRPSDAVSPDPPIKP